MTGKQKFLIGSIAIPLIVAFIGLLPWLAPLIVGKADEENLPSITDSSNVGESTLEKLADDNYCLLFDGHNDFVQVSNVENLPIRKDFTVELWVKPRSPNSNVDAFIQATAHTLDEEEKVTLNSGWLFAYRGDGRPLFTLAVTEPSGKLGKLSVFGEPLRLERWQHIAATYDRKEVKVFHDGLLSGSKELNGSFVKPFNKILLGSWAPWFRDGSYHGEIDEVRLWSVARTEEQISQYKNKSLEGNEAGLVCYWRLDEKSGQVINNAVHGGPQGFLGDVATERDNADPNFIVSGRSVE